mmetsp:Transcript_27545/g.36119  ORF Transcript_27545/g.36119 Transcript_27545/m.36119 type:complete len:549 (+) Transcript_27545:185-1831(+)
MFLIQNTLLLILTLFVNRSFPHEHAHEESTYFEYVSVYSFDASTYTLKVPNDSSESEFKFLAISTDSADAHGLEEAEELKEESDWDDFVLHLCDGNVISLHQNLMVSLEIEEDEAVSALSFEFHETHTYAFFFEHSPDEVSFQIEDSSGNVFSPALSEEHEHDHDEHEHEEHEHEDHDEHEHEDEDDHEEVVATAKIWGVTVVASLITSALSASGLVLFMLIASKDLRLKCLNFAHAFGSGAILAASLIHLIPESLAFLEEYEDGEDLGWKSGTVILAGMLLSLLIHAMLEPHKDDEPEVSVVVVTPVVPQGIVTGADDDEHQAQSKDSDTEDDLEKTQTKKKLVGDLPKALVHPCAKVSPECWNLFVGDFVHNFLDGCLIASAFLSCGMTSGWTVFGAVAAHEVPQEIADFFIFVKSGMSYTQAVLFNFVSGLSSFLGAIILLAASTSMTKEHLGYLLLGGAGIFLFIGATELLPQMLENSKQKKVFIMQLLAFALGAVVVSLPLLHHVHCDSGAFGHDHDHEGHGHDDHGGENSHSDHSSHDGHDH